MSARWVAVAGIALVFAAPAQAGQLTRSADGATLTYTAAAGEVDAVSLFHDLFNPGMLLFVPGPGGDDITFAGGSLCAPGASSGEVTCQQGTLTRVVFELGDRDDRVTVGSFDFSNTAGDLPLAVTLNGGDGADGLTAGPRADRLNGGGGADLLVGDPGLGTAGNDELEGGGGNDRLDGGGGADSLHGGAGGRDLADYGRRANDVTVTIDGVANDGEQAVPESDNVHTDVEDVRGGGGADVIVGSPVANVLSGGSGRDRVDGGGGFDLLHGDDGDDLLRARDGVGDWVDCGEGTDEAVIDEVDWLAACEVIDRSVALLPDADGDGVPRPLDCDDGSPVVRPGALEVPGNAVDENCDGRAAPFQVVQALVQSEWRRGRGFVVVRALVVRAALDGARVALRCSGRGCPRRRARPVEVQGGRAVSLKRGLRGARLRRGAVVEVRITRDDAIGQLFRFRVGRRGAPRRTMRCLAPGTGKATKC